MEPDVGGSNPPSCTKLMNKKTFKPSSELPAGFVDRQEEELLARDLLISNIKKVMAKYGFQYLETPSFEFTDSIGKFLPDKDRPSEGVFSFEDDKKWLSLRYDLTAPLARYAAKNFNNLILSAGSFSYWMAYLSEATNITVYENNSQDPLQKQNAWNYNKKVIFSN